MTRQVELRFGRHVHPVYREQLHAEPEGWTYVHTAPELGDSAAPTKRIAERRSVLGPLRERAEFVALRMLSAGGYVHRIRARPQSGVQLIHAAERLLWRSPVPYVVDLEHVDLFVLYQRAAFDRPWTRTMLESALLDDRLKFLLPWSDAARRSVLAVVSPEAARALEPKLRTVYPAVRLAAERPRERAGGTLRVLFIGTMFFEKGGVEALLALREVRRSHDVELDIVTYAPPDWSKRLQDEPGVRLHAPGGQDLIRRLYAQSDVLLFPSHMDTYGVVVGEAMAHGLPVVAPRHLALTETIHDEVSGLLFPPENMLWREDTRCRFKHTIPVPRSYLRSLRYPSEEYVAGIAGTLGRLAEEPGLYDRLATGCFESVASGHLSIPRRRALLREIYDAAAA
jgi:glycosyltransferase involved in cell wall biosynthesis